MPLVKDVIGERRTHFECVGHRSDIHFGKDIVRQIGLDVQVKQAVELHGKVSEAPGIVIENGDVPARHVGDVNVMSLIGERD